MLRNMVQSSDEMAITILKRIQESVSCGICHNIITNPMRNLCGHRFCTYCIVNALDPTEDICNCPKCNAAINRNRLIQDIVFGKIVNKAGQLIDSIRGSDLSDKPSNKIISPQGKRRLPTERCEDIDLDKSIEETEAEAREMARDVGGKGTKRTLDTINEPVEAVKRSFAMPKTSTPTGSDKRPSDKQASPSPKRIRESLHRKLSFEGEERMLMSDSSDSEDRRIRSGVTYSRFDRVKQSIRKNNCSQTDIAHRKDQYQQTDGTNNSDLYSTLSNLFNCLCTQHGIQGSILIEGIGRFEINLSKPTDQLNGSQVDQSHVALMIDKRIQTEPEPIEEKPVTKEKGINTSIKITKEIEIQVEMICDKHDKASSPRRNEPSDTQIVEESELTVNINGTTREHHDKLGDIEVTHEVTSISQIVKDFSEDPINSQDDYEGTRYDHIKASTRISAFGKVDDETDVDATELVTQTNASSTKGDILESDIEDDPPRNDIDEDSNIVLESDEDDKFLMSCVFDTLDDDDEIESVRSLDTNSIKSTGINAHSSRNLGQTSESENETLAQISNNSMDF
ncbi:uncharacterized protein LOC128388461 isoform X2 [Panonychus citri]|uniref:uncharacterized protein LOC128388461 isoform X2 n=1 Tax=Panonychus citri TaxID=50023 RepID=UPI002306E7B2|nr:uncharacterized protein LOC128388461 isoform X2 [Panonychus citri]